MDKEILNTISSIYGIKCCRVAIGNGNSLSIGFGEKIFHNNPKLKDKYYGEWEIGTYYGSWRIIKNNRIILGSNDFKDDIELVNRRVNDIIFGSIKDINNYSPFDVRVIFNDGMIIDFISTFIDDDEIFHIFCPGGKYIEFKAGGLWEIGKSNTPWEKT